MRLGINVDHVATVREARQTDAPDPVRAAVLAELGGADDITVHLREDRRHIQERDVELLLETVRTGITLELAADEEVLSLAEAWSPMQATLVPERREEVTTEGGLDLTGENRPRIQDAIARLEDAGVRPLLFVDPEEEGVETAAELGAAAVELHTGEYANAAEGPARREQLIRLERAATAAAGAGLGVHLGHGLTYGNVGPVAAIPEAEELSIGHSVVSRSIFVGMERAVREMKELITRVRRAG